jgi:hypothetical protein
VHRIWLHRSKRWRHDVWYEPPERCLYGELGLVNVGLLIPSLASGEIPFRESRMWENYLSDLSGRPRPGPAGRTSPDPTSGIVETPKLDREGRTSASTVPGGEVSDGACPLEPITPVVYITRAPAQAMLGGQKVFSARLW